MGNEDYWIGVFTGAMVISLLSIAFNPVWFGLASSIFFVFLIFVVKNKINVRRKPKNN